MSNDLTSREAGNEREHAKIKTNFAKIIVEGTAKMRECEGGKTWQGGT